MTVAFNQAGSTLVLYLVYIIDENVFSFFLLFLQHIVKSHSVHIIDVLIIIMVLPL